MTTENINIGISPDTITAASNGASSLVHTIADTVKQSIETYGGSAQDLAEVYLRVDAFSGSLFPFAVSLIGLFVLYMIGRKVFRHEYLGHSNPRLVKALLVDYGNRTSEDDAVVLRCMKEKSSRVPKLTKAEILDRNLSEELNGVYRWSVDGDSVMNVMTAWLSLFIGCGLIITLCIAITHVWAWIGMFYPEIYAVHMAVGKL